MPDIDAVIFDWVQSHVSVLKVSLRACYLTATHHEGGRSNATTSVDPP